MTMFLHDNEVRLIAVVMQAAGVSKLRIPVEAIARAADGEGGTLFWHEDPMTDELVLSCRSAGVVIDGEEAPLPAAALESR